MKKVISSTRKKIKKNTLSHKHRGKIVGTVHQSSGAKAYTVLRRIGKPKRKAK